MFVWEPDAASRKDYPSTVLRRYVYGPWVDEPLAVYDYTGSGTDLKYYHTDHAGSIIAMSDDDVDGMGLPAGDLTDTFSYSSFGEVGLEGLEGNPYRYTGRRLDAETGLYYYRARYYSAELGRFLQTDPIGYGDGMNMYAYVGNDPVNFIDPTGTSLCVTQTQKFEVKNSPDGEAVETFQNTVTTCLFDGISSLLPPDTKGIVDAIRQTARDTTDAFAELTRCGAFAVRLNTNTSDIGAKWSPPKTVFA